MILRAHDIITSSFLDKTSVAHVAKLLQDN